MFSIFLLLNKRKNWHNKYLISSVKRHMYYLLQSHQFYVFIAKHMDSFPKLGLYYVVSVIGASVFGIDGTFWSTITGSDQKVYNLANGRIAKKKTESKPEIQNYDPKWYMVPLRKFDMKKRIKIVDDAVKFIVRSMVFKKTFEEYRMKSQSSSDAFDVEMLRTRCYNMMFDHYEYRQFCKIMDIVPSSFDETAQYLHMVNLDHYDMLCPSQMFMFFVISTFRAYVNTIDVYARKPLDRTKLDKEFLPQSKYFYGQYVLASPHEKRSYGQMVDIIIEHIKETFFDQRTPARRYDYDDYADYDNDEYVDCYFPPCPFFDDSESFGGSHFPDSHKTFDEEKCRRQMMGRKNSKKVVVHGKTETKKSQKKHDKRIF